MKKQTWINYAVIALVSIIAHWLLLYLAYAATRSGGDLSPISFFENIYNTISNAGDTPHYVDIAENWYHATGDGANNIVFFPLYPLLMKGISFLCGNHVTAGIIISNVCLGIANIFLSKLLSIDYDKEKSFFGLIIFNLYPVGFFLIGAYTESLFIMLVLMCLYYIRRQKTFAVGIIGMLAAFSRSQGIVLLVPAVYESVVTIFESHRATKNKRSTLITTLKQLPVLLIPVGTVAYFIINQVVYGSWNKFLEFQAAEPWFNTSHWITDNLGQQYHMATNYPFLDIITYWPEFLLFFIGMFLIIYGYVKKNVRTSYLAYGTAFIFVTYLHGWMISGLRYMMSCVVIYIVLAASDNKILKYSVTIATGILSVLFYMWFTQGQSIL